MIPSGFHAWAHARNVSPFHPLTWDAETRSQFQAWKIAAFKARWRVAVENGDVSATRRLCGRDYLLRKVREDVEGALAPPPSDVYRACDCHPSAPWGSPQASGKEPRTPAEVIMWLATEFSPGTAALRTRGA